MKRRQLAALIPTLSVAMPVFAQATEDDPFRFTGEATVGYIGTDTSGKDLSKFEQYQDLNDGVLSNIGFVGRNSKSWVDAYGENFTVMTSPSVIA